MCIWGKKNCNVMEVTFKFSDFLARSFVAVDCEGSLEEI